ncbi:MAG: TauD/TfdA family dioxygenase [Pseudomonadales bacterium]|jgi:alpha-ketoglutarate-dependent taurine dioxygenase|tara:strand:+ start:1886 stop:2866 length:981 start_codon:yes stop_codon:yes gene_type:complete
MTSLSIQEIALDQQQHYEDVFPLVYASENSLSTLTQVHEWLGENKERLLEQLSRHGAILFRGLPVNSDSDFDSVIQSFGLKNFTYAESLSNAVRRNRTERVFTANEAPASVSIFLHHEMAQTPIYPSKLFFYCEQAAHSGGATPLCRSDILLQELTKQAPEFVAACLKLGVRYSNVMPNIDDLESGQGRSWRSTLSTDDKSAAEDKLRKLGYQWEWLEQDSLRVTTAVLPAVRETDNGRQVFFNQLIAAFRGWKDTRNATEKSIRFGDDSAISTQAMAKAIHIGDELSFDIPWQSGDVALVDNFLVMHGRRPFEGQRRVLASLIAD